MISYDSKHLLYFICCHVHSKTLDDKQHSAPHLHLLHPFFVQNRTGDRRNPAFFLIDRITHFYGFRQIQVIPGEPSIVHTVCTGIQSAGNVHHSAVRVFGNKLTDQFIKNNAPCHNSAAHGGIFFCIAEIVIQTVDQFLCLGIVKFVFGIFAVHGTGIKALKHGFGGAV